MPKFDGTGPRGEGPKSGRAMGPCNKKGLGRGQRQRYNAEKSKNNGKNQ